MGGTIDFEGSFGSQVNKTVHMVNETNFANMNQEKGGKAISTKI